MRLLTFSSRNAKEILRDPLNVAFSLGFPVILLFLSRSKLLPRALPCLAFPL